MGLDSSKEKICKILEKSINNINYKSNLKINYKKGNGMNNEKYNEESNSEDKDYQEDIYNEIDIKGMPSPLLDVKNTKKYPYITIGRLTVRFPLFDDDEYFTCFLIDTNVVITLACNIENKNKGGKAKSISTTFSNEKVKWENIIIQGEEKIYKKKEKTEEKTLDKIYKSKLAAIFFEDNIGSEWIGVEGGNKEDFAGKDINVVFALPNPIEGENDSTKPNKLKFKEINVNNINPFRKLESGEEITLCKSVPGSPIYYKNFNSGAYAIAIVNELLEFQFFDKETMKFLIRMVNKGKLLRKQHKGIFKLDLSKNNLRPLDLKYLTDFDLKNLTNLDLSSNSIGPQGAFYLSSWKFHSLESLNLSFNEIRDEGMNYIANGFLNKLNYLYLFHNNISDNGIKYLVKAKFFNDLIYLSLSDNPNIGDVGIKIIKMQGWANLITLELNGTGLTDEALDYLGKIVMPRLRALIIIDNNFTEKGKLKIEDLRNNHNYVIVTSEKEINKINIMPKKKNIDIKISFDDESKYLDEIQFKEKYQNLGIIGEGAYGKVYKSINNSDEYIAIKEIDIDKFKKSGYHNEEDIETFKNHISNEIKNMIICSEENSNINTVKFYDYYYNENKIYIIMELCAESLNDLLKRKEKGFNVEEIYDIIQQLNKTFKLMYDNYIMHRDLKLENILVKYTNEQKTEYIVKLADYGISRQLKSFADQNYTVIGTRKTMAPEILKNKEYNNKCDLWSLGVIIYMLYFKKRPFQGETDKVLLLNIKKGLKNQLTENEILNDLLINLLKKNPKKRMSWEQYFKHPFCQKMDLSKKKK